jgi:hypothetical protein
LRHKINEVETELLSSTCPNGRIYVKRDHYSTRYVYYKYLDPSDKVQNLKLIYLSGELTSYKMLINGNAAYIGIRIGHGKEAYERYYIVSRTQNVAVETSPGDQLASIEWKNVTTSYIME